MRTYLKFILINIAIILVMTILMLAYPENTIVKTAWAVHMCLTMGFSIRYQIKKMMEIDKKFDTPFFRGEK